MAACVHRGVPRKGCVDELREMVNALWLTEELHWDLALYWLFLINVVLLALLPVGSWLQTMLGIITIVFIVIDKTHAFGYIFDSGHYGPIRCHETVFFGTYIARVMLFVIPLSVAGLTRKGSVRAVGIIAGITGAVYTFARWYIEQRNVSTTALTCAFLNFDMVAQNAGLALVLARICLRSRLCLGTVHRDIPITVGGELAAHEVKVEAA